VVCSQRPQRQEGLRGFFGTRIALLGWAVKVWHLEEKEKRRSQGREESNHGTDVEPDQKKNPGPGGNLGQTILWVERSRRQALIEKLTRGWRFSYRERS